jgi:hypothetical protein
MVSSTGNGEEIVSARASISATTMPATPQAKTVINDRDRPGRRRGFGLDPPLSILGKS